MENSSNSRQVMDEMESPSLVEATSLSTQRDDGQPNSTCAETGQALLTHNGQSVVKCSKKLLSDSLGVDGEELEGEACFPGFLKLNTKQCDVSYLLSPVSNDNDILPVEISSDEDVIVIDRGCQDMALASSKLVNSYVPDLGDQKNSIISSTAVTKTTEQSVLFYKRNGSESFIFDCDSLPRNDADSSENEESSKTGQYGTFENNDFRMSGERKLINNELQDDGVTIPSDHVTSLDRNSADVIHSTDVEDASHFAFEDLPPELVQKIFSFLSPVELCKKVVPVCSQWRDFAYDPAHWQALDLEFCSNADADALLLCFKHTPRLKRLNIRGRQEFAIHEFMNLCEACPELQELNLGFCDFIDLQIIKCLSSTCTNLQVLNVEGCSSINDVSAHIMTQLSSLRSLNISHCEPISDDGIIVIARHLHQLESLNIDGIAWITDKAVQEIVRSLQQTLRHLWVDGAELTDSSVQLISQCKRLKTFSISFAELLTDTALEHIQNLQALRELTVHKGVNFSSIVLMKIFQSGSFPYLHDLDLSECVAVNNDVCITIMESCGKNLVKLALRWCWNISDVGLSAIVDHCKKLEHLDLCGLDKITGICFNKIPRQMTVLTYINLIQCNKIIDQLIVDIIREVGSRLNRNMRVINYYGEEFVYA